QLYTLSLHDALPISSARESGLVAVERDDWRRMAWRALRSSWPVGGLPAGTRLDVGTIRIIAMPLYHGRPRERHCPRGMSNAGWIDRKSTRLNSSHVK